jgi:hypothetical protein
MRYAPDNIGAYLALIELYKLNYRKDLMAKTVISLLNVAKGRKIDDLIEHERLRNATYIPAGKIILPLVQEAFRYIMSQSANDQIYK